MKTRFNTYDIVCGVTELQRLVGLRVNQIYDVDKKTYLIRLQGGESKTMLLIESGIRFHTTAFDWPKNMAPSGFSMKLRKHLKNKRLEKLQQLGVDRIVDFQFGMGEAAYHIIVELYDRGNIILADYEMTILYILRPHCEGEEMRFAVREKYPEYRAKEQCQELTKQNLQKLLLSAPPGENLRRILMPVLDCGPAVIDHVLHKHKLESVMIKPNINKFGEIMNSSQSNSEKKQRKQKPNDFKALNFRLFHMEDDMEALWQAIQDAKTMLIAARSITSQGYIIQKEETKSSLDSESMDSFYQNIEFHPYSFHQFERQPMISFPTFMLSVDEFYSSLEGQKIDLKTLQQERDALKKLSNVKKDHARRLEELAKLQDIDKQRADLITCNQELVDSAILAIRSVLANQMSWPDIQELVNAAQSNGDTVAKAIKQLKLKVNHISLMLSDVYSSNEPKNEANLSLIVDVDVGLTAWANARKYYDQKRIAEQKEQKTINASQKALKSAERKTQQALKEVRTISMISKARKVYWFEKFYWFISSENYLIIGGRDAQQNELIVKRYMRSSDIYVHAEIQGASSVVIRNPTGAKIPPKTLLEAGTMAISYSVAWDAKVVTNAYWVHSNQVSKKAPTGEYLATGSFMVRGKKNFLPSCHLIMGLSLLFKLEDSFVEEHRGERKVRTFAEEDRELTEVQFKDLTIEKEKFHTDYKEMEIDMKLPNEKSNEWDDSGKEELSNFPDTQVQIEHDTGRVTIRNVSMTDTTADLNLFEVENEKSSSLEETIISAAPPRQKYQQNAKKRKEEKERQIKNNLKDQERNANANQSKPLTQIKRGHKGKLKKIRSKYKDQDEDERELRMRILNSSGKNKLESSEKKSNEISPIVSTNKPAVSIELKEQQHDDIDDIDDIVGGVDVEMLDFLTGQPFEEDELLFALPVVAPYQSLQNYKFKVKLTPGTGKRGRAARTALTIFSKDKSCGPREKVLLKGIKEETLARNIPGKVKLSAPHLQKLKI